MDLFFHRETPLTKWIDVPSSRGSNWEVSLCFYRPIIWFPLSGSWNIVSSPRETRSTRTAFRRTCGHSRTPVVRLDAVGIRPMRLCWELVYQQSALQSQLPYLTGGYLESTSSMQVYTQSGLCQLDTLQPGPAPVERLEGLV